MAISNGVDKKWALAPKISDELKNQFPEINPIILQLLYSRGLKTQKEIDEFLLPDYSQDLHDPFIFQDMGKAVERIYRAIANKEKILIFGDYDTDGVTASSLLVTIFKKIGAENVDVYIPDREAEGYSLNMGAIEKFIQQGINLIVTCDCGITGIKEIDLANQNGIDVIITDHHLEPKILPQAYAIINPQLSREKYPFKPLAGVGVAFKLSQALLKSEKCLIANKEAAEKWLLDLVAVGTIGDMMPVLGENRTLIKYGIKVLNKTQNRGLRLLTEKAGLTLGNISAYNVGYQISPRLNAAGRMNHANDALDLLLATDAQQAQKLADKINSLNEARQREVDKIFKTLQNSLGETPKEKLLLVDGEDWKIGILGLIAGKLCDYYCRPVLAFSKTNDKLRGRGRSSSVFNLYNALNKLTQYDLDFGGHAESAGFTLKNPAEIEQFKKDISAIAEEELKFVDFRPTLNIDSEVKFDEITWELYGEIEKFNPFGEDNPSPNFLLQGIELRNIEIVGQNSEHRRLIVGDSALSRKMIFFGAGNKVRDIRIGDKLDVVFQLSVNQWNGQQELQMKVIDLKRHDVNNFD